MVKLRRERSVDENGNMFEKRWNENGQLIFHKYTDDNGNGVWKEWHDNGQLGLHLYWNENNKWIGKDWFRNGELAKHEYVDENGNVVKKEWHENGQLKYDEYADDNGKEVRKFWDENGQLKLHWYTDKNGKEIRKGSLSLVRKVNGKLNRHEYTDKKDNDTKKRWYGNGQLRSHLYFDESGNRVRKGWYKSGEFGYHRYIDESGNRVRKGWYKSGQIKDHRYTDESGNHVAKQWHENGQLNYHYYINKNGNKIVKIWDGNYQWEHGYIDENGNAVESGQRHLIEERLSEIFFKKYGTESKHVLYMRVIEDLLDNPRCDLEEKVRYANFVNFFKDKVKEHTDNIAKYYTGNLHDWTSEVRIGDIEDICLDNGMTQEEFDSVCDIVSMGRIYGISDITYEQLLDYGYRHAGYQPGNFHDMLIESNSYDELYFALQNLHDDFVEAIKGAVEKVAVDFVWSMIRARKKEREN